MRGWPLKFDRVEYGEIPQSLFHCAFCGRGLDQLRFEVAGRAACPVCVSRVTAQLPVDDRRTFLRAAGAGILAALGASLAYLLVLRILSAGSDWSLSIFAALGVGWMVGKSMKWAARGAGGRRYQWVGAVLAYAAAFYPLQFLMLGMQGDPWWAYPLLLFCPVAFLFSGLKTVGVVQLCAAFVAVRWAWSVLRRPYNPVQEIEGPRT